MKDLLKNAREEKQFTTRKLGELVNTDQALISKFENGYRLPTKKQVFLLSEILEINLDELLTSWYKQKLINNLDFNQNSIKAVTEILQEKGIQLTENSEKENKISDILSEIENLKTKLSNL